MECATFGAWSKETREGTSGTACSKSSPSSAIFSKGKVFNILGVFEEKSLGTDHRGNCYGD